MFDSEEEKKDEYWQDELIDDLFEDEEDEMLGLFAELSKSEYDAVLRSDASITPRLKANENFFAALKAKDEALSDSEDERRRQTRMMEAQRERELTVEDKKELRKKYRIARKNARKRNILESRREKAAAYDESERIHEEYNLERIHRHRRLQDYRRETARENYEILKRQSEVYLQDRENENNRKKRINYYKRKAKEEEKLAEAKEASLQPERKSRLKGFLGAAIYIAFIFGLAFFIMYFVVQKTVVSGNSMYPTLESGDQLMIEKISYRFGSPKRFDIIVFKVSESDNKYYIKRVIGLPKETVQIIDGDIYIDGEVLDEDYGYEEMEYPGIAYEPIELGDDEYFVLGDNRNNSTDSRYDTVGNVTSKQILGHAVLRIWPLSDITLLTD